MVLDCSVQKWETDFLKLSRERSAPENLSDTDIQKAISCQNSTIFH